MAENILEVRQLEVVYNRVATAIQGVSLDVPQGSITALGKPYLDKNFPKLDSIQSATISTPAK